MQGEQYVENIIWEHTVIYLPADSDTGVQPFSVDLSG